MSEQKPDMGDCITKIAELKEFDKNMGERRAWFSFYFWTAFGLFMVIFMVCAVGYNNKIARETKKLAERPVVVAIPTYSQAEAAWKTVCKMDWQEKTNLTQEQMNAVQELRFIIGNKLLVDLPDIKARCSDYKIYQNGLPRAEGRVKNKAGHKK